MLLDFFLRTAKGQIILITRTWHGLNVPQHSLDYQLSKYLYILIVDSVELGTLNTVFLAGTLTCKFECQAVQFLGSWRVWLIFTYRRPAASELVHERTAGCECSS